MNNMNIDENTLKNIKNMVDNGNLSDAISQISPEMMQNFSKMLSNPNTKNEQENSNTTNNQAQTENNTSNNFDLNNIDIDTIMKFSSAFG